MYKSIIVVFFLSVIVACSDILYDELLSSPSSYPHDSPPKNSLSVATWNIHGGHTWFGTSNVNNIKREFSNSLSKEDIVFLQEVPQSELLDELAEKYGYHKSGTRNAILSKYPILASEVIVINPGTGRTATWADIEYTDKIAIRIYSIHLSYKIKRWLYIPVTRGAELKRLIDHAYSFEGPVILAGDFNTTDLIGSKLDKRPVFQKAYQAGFKNAFLERQCNTHLILGRIDWVFYKGMSAWFSGCGIYAGSDHRHMNGTFFNIN